MTISSQLVCTDAEVSRSEWVADAKPDLANRGHVVSAQQQKDLSLAALFQERHKEQLPLQPVSARSQVRLMGAESGNVCSGWKRNKVQLRLLQALVG